MFGVYNTRLVQWITILLQCVSVTDFYKRNLFESPTTGDSFFQIVVKGVCVGGEREDWNFSGGGKDFFARWGEPQKEWFQQFKPF